MNQLVTYFGCLINQAGCQDHKDFERTSLVRKRSKSLTPLTVGGQQDLSGV